MRALEAKNVSIRYITGDFKDIGLKEFIIRRLKGEYHVNEFWADRNISFMLERGDMLGIIGSNGAGKSTLLKAVSGIMIPTEGWIHREGSVVALLELASGFDGADIHKNMAKIYLQLGDYDNVIAESRKVLATGEKELYPEASCNIRDAYKAKHCAYIETRKRKPNDYSRS